MPKVPQELKDPNISRQVRFAYAPKHAQRRLAQRKQALGAMLMHVTTGLCLLRMLDELMHVSLPRPVAAR